MFQASTADIFHTSQPTALNTKRAWILIGIWSGFLALCLLARGGRILIPLFPLGSVAVGLFLYFRTPALYVGYTWWLYFVGSLVRRMIDQQSGYVTPGRWGTTALLVASISLITLVKYLPKSYRRIGFPFVLPLLAVTYGCLIGFITGRLDLQFAIGALGWIVPIVFSFHLVVNWQQYPQYRQAIQRTFVWGALAMGCYGIFQYCIVPEWDRFYLNNLSASSFGKPFPFEIRVFSTQNSPQDFGVIMMAGLILLLSSEGVIRLVASGPGYIAFLLSAARSSWLGWVAALLAYLPSLKLKFQVRLILSILLIALMVVPLTTIEPFAEPIKQRIESLSEGGDDYSLQDRTEGYQNLLDIALTEFIGSGIGGRLSRQLPASAIGGSDSGILPLLFTLGWFGAVPYLAGIFLMVYRILTSRGNRQDPFSSAAQAIVMGVLAQVWLNNIFAGEMAMVLWGFLGIGVAASQYYAHQRSTQMTSYFMTDSSSTNLQHEP
ncbi:MAG: O-antigen ligase family protein [Oscillatoriales cyanobacterium C42_A2020_001]|nr:O-antigen ligase family protein [Leptolyngbyaceae cyanobacterium C42_A2020_001]